MIDLIIPQRRRDLGGFEVGRVLPHHGGKMVGPFIFFDHMGPVDFEPGIPRSVDVRPHPHIGLATVTYLFEGEIMHRDSVGSEQPILPGEMNWMIAGRGITHSERFERARREGGRMHGIQAWVALPESEEERAPSFHHHPVADLPTYESAGLWARLVAGEAHGAKAKVEASSPMFYIHWKLEPGVSAALPGGYAERAAYVAVGEAEMDGQVVKAGEMAIFAAGKPAVVKAVPSSRTPAIVMALGGEPLGPRFIEWNFVSSRRERIEQAKADWRARRMKLPDLDDQEFTPLPGG